LIKVPPKTFCCADSFEYFAHAVKAGAVRIGEFSKWLMASPAFLASHKLSDDPPSTSTLPFIAANKKSSFFSQALLMDTMPACRAAAVAGAGVARLPDFTIGADFESGRLVSIYDEWATTAPIQVVIPPGKHTSAKVRAFIDTSQLEKVVGTWRYQN
jgi:DNA-binding transcriptional LysR family regulator